MNDSLPANPAMRKTPVFHSYGKWYLSGVNTWTVNLIRAMDGSDYESKVLFTGEARSPQPDLDDLGIPYEFLEVATPRKRQHEWNALKSFLEAHAPCIYITNFDFHRSCAVGTLSPDVHVVTVLHSDEDCYYDEVRRIGRDCDAVVCVSSALIRTVRKKLDHLVRDLRFIPYGIPLIPGEVIPSRPQSGPLRLCYCNRLQQYQKRIFDLPIIAAELERLGVDYEFDIAGDGPDAEELRNRFQQADLRCPVRFHGRVTNAAVMDLCRHSHLFLLTSDFEGLPISLLEAMSVGCVPVVYDIDSGIGDAIPGPGYGSVVPHGSTAEYARVIANIDQDRPSLQVIAGNARRLIHESFSLDRMAMDYGRLFAGILNSAPKVRRSGRIVVPADLSLTGRISRRIRQLTGAGNPGV